VTRTENWLLKNKN